MFADLCFCCIILLVDEISNNKSDVLPMTTEHDIVINFDSVSQELVGCWTVGNWYNYMKP